LLSLSAADVRAVELHIILRQRLLLGLCNASDNSIGCDSWIIYDYPAILNWTDDSAVTVFKRVILGGSMHCAAFLLIHQS
jgi:hypothetical protein